MYRCAAPNCTVMAGKGVSLFYFPKKDDKRCKEWVDKLKRKDFTPSNTSKLCARHFTNDSFTMHPATAKLVNFRKLFLRRDAVPSIFEYSPESPPERKPTPENEPGPSAAKLGRHEEKTTVFKTPALLQPELCHQGPLDGGRTSKRGTKRKHATPVVSFVNSFCQTIPAKSQKKTGSQSGNQNSENGEKKAATSSMKSSIPESASVAASEQLTPSQEQTLAPSTQISVTKPKPVEKPKQQEKRFFVVAGHQRYVLCRLASLWKKGTLCDAGLSNGSFTVKVHKLVLHAMCPRLFSVSSKDIRSHGFLQLNVPKEVSEEALNAFAEYMYTGILDLDSEILEQFKIIAKRLDMKEFEGLCDTRLASTKQKPSSATVSSAESFANIPSTQSTQVPAMTSSVESPGSSVSNFMQSATVSTALLFNNVSSTQTTTPVLAVTKSLDSPVSASIQSSPSINTPVIDIKQETSEDNVAHVKREDDAMFGQESEVASQAPDLSENDGGSVITPSIKIELVGPADDQYGRWSGSNTGYQAFISTTSSSLSSSIVEAACTASVPSSSSEFIIPSSEETDVKSTRLKALHSYEPPLLSDSSPVSSSAETMRTQSSSMKKYSSSQSSSAAQSTDTPKSNNAVYPVRLFTARGDNLPLITKDSSDPTTLDSLVPREKT